MEQYRILHEDEDILVAAKLAPVPVQPEKTGDPSLQDLLRAELAARAAKAEAADSEAIPLEAVHRIDRRVSGAVVFAKTHRALETLGADFRKRLIDKYYIACVERRPPADQGRLEHRLVWDKRRNVVKAFRVATPTGGAAPSAPQPATQPAAQAGGSGRPAEGAPDKGERGILEYRLAGESERYFFLEIRLVTGKHHQIRAQLAAEGMPIRGDIKYGARRTNRNGLLMLHARRLVLTQPRTRETIEILAPFPESEPLWAALEPGKA